MKRCWFQQNPGNEKIFGLNISDKSFFGSELDDMSEDLVVSIFDENDNIEQESLLLGKVTAFRKAGYENELVH